MPAWSTSEWVTVLSTFFAALAALAAWVTVLASWRQQRRAAIPHVTGGLLVAPDGTAQLSVANAGPGFAVAVSYAGVEDGQKYASTVGNGLLAAGADRVQTLPIRLQRRGGQAHFVLLWRDLDNNMYMSSADGRTKRYSARKVRKRKVPTKSWDLFHVLYPDITVP